MAETLNMSQLSGYSTGGTLHVVVNNQIGFTTLPEDARSSMYATDIAKMIEVPIFHVNGDDPLAVMFVTETALDFRQEFGRDVVIDHVLLSQVRPQRSATSRHSRSRIFTRKSRSALPSPNFISASCSRRAR